MRKHSNHFLSRGSVLILAASLFFAGCSLGSGAQEEGGRLAGESASSPLRRSQAQTTEALPAGSSSEITPPRETTNPVPSNDPDHTFAFSSADIAYNGQDIELDEETTFFLEYAAAEAVSFHPDWPFDEAADFDEGGQIEVLVNPSDMPRLFVSFARYFYYGYPAPPEIAVYEEHEKTTRNYTIEGESFNLPTVPIDKTKHHVEALYGSSLPQDFLEEITEQGFSYAQDNDFSFVPADGEGATWVEFDTFYTNMDLLMAQGTAYIEYDEGSYPVLSVFTPNEASICGYSYVGSILYPVEEN